MNDEPIKFVVPLDVRPRVTHWRGVTSRLDFDAACHERLAHVLAAYRSMVSAYFRHACRVYLAHHRRLPGSERTRRLRKKRIRLVWQFYTRWLRGRQ